MPIKRIIFCFLCLLFLLCGCTGSAPAAGTLLSFETRPFLCGFTVTERVSSSGEASYSAALQRQDGIDTLTVTAPHSRVVFRFENNQACLVTEGSDGEEPLCLPVTLPENHGAGYLRSLFCLPPTEDLQVITCAGGYCLCDGTGKLRLTFSDRGIPLLLETDTVTLNVTSFTFTENQDR